VTNLVLSVPGISCGHCANAITATVRTVVGVDTVAVDVAAKTVRVAGTADDSQVRAAIADAGYQAA
jgi:copper chaperone CopZ